MPNPWLEKVIESRKESNREGKSEREGMGHGGMVAWGHEKGGKYPAGVFGALHTTQHNCEHKFSAASNAAGGVN